MQDAAQSGTPGELNANGSFDVSTGQYTFSVLGQGLRPTPGSSQPVAGTFRLEAHGTGTFENPGFSAQVNGNDVRIGGLMVGELRCEAEARDHHASGVITAPALNIKVASTIAMERD